MQWQKKGLIFTVNQNAEWMMSHAQVPLVELQNHETLRIYFGTRDKDNRTITTFIEVDAKNPSQVTYIHDQPVLGLGKLGCFDDSGAMPSWIVNYQGLKYLYYTGWNVGTTVPYRNSIGVAVSEDDGYTFSRLYEGPILDRTYLEPYICAVPCILIENGLWRMWYLSGTKWEVCNNKSEPYYHIKYAESQNGIDWIRRGIVCIDFKASTEAGIVRPCVLLEDGIYKMWYSYRGVQDYRSNTVQSYRIGYAESPDGIRWERKDELVGINISESGWDCEMIAYPYIQDCHGKRYLFYNGNGFGKSGIGYAELK